jgi:glucose/mannose transport system substrate-binding protein
MKIAFRSSLSLLGFALLAAGCSGPDAQGASDAGGGAGSATADLTVEVFSWWRAPGEAEALQSLLDLHEKEYPNEHIYNAATDPKVVSGGNEAKVVLQDRLMAGDPPDAFQTNAFELKRGYIAEQEGLLEPLDELFAAQRLADELAPEALADVTVNGHYMAVPVNIHRENGLFYNITVFKDNGLEPPKTMADFMDVCAKLTKAGVTPLAISTSQGWIIDKVFVALAAGTMGADDFVKYFRDKQPADAAALAPVVDVLDQVLTDCIDVEGAAMDGFGWTQAADALKDGSAAMFMHGDWAKGYLVQQGATPDVDFGVVASPDASGVVVYGMDVFAVPSGAQHLEGAFDWLRTISSADGQVTFNNYKGSSPVRLDVPDTGLDVMAKVIYADFKNATHRVPAPGLPGAWDDGFVQLARDHDKQALLKIMVANPVGG